MIDPSVGRSIDRSLKVAALTLATDTAQLNIAHGDCEMNLPSTVRPHHWPTDRLDLVPIVMLESIEGRCVFAVLDSIYLSIYLNISGPSDRYSDDRFSWWIALLALTLDNLPARIVPIWIGHPRMVNLMDPWQWHESSVRYSRRAQRWCRALVPVASASFLSQFDVTVQPYLLDLCVGVLCQSLQIGEFLNCCCCCWWCWCRCCCWLKCAKPLPSNVPPNYLWLAIQLQLVILKLILYERTHTYTLTHLNTKCTLLVFLRLAAIIPFRSLIRLILSLSTHNLRVRFDDSREIVSNYFRFFRKKAHAHIDETKSNQTKSTTQKNMKNN